MTDRATIREATPLSKAEKRAAAKVAKARAAAAARRRQMLGIVGAAVAVLAVIAVVVVLAVRGGNSPAQTQSGAGATPTAAAETGAPTPAATQAAATQAAFPPVPAGADPALSKKPEAKAGTGTVSKLQVTTLVEGKGAAAQAGQTITVNYVGVTYADGKQFDASWDHQQAFSFALGGGQVIKGWDQGLVGVKVGSRVQLDIPASLAYGDTPSGGRPAGALRFVVDVLGVA